MSDEERRWWFVARHKNHGRLLHLISARSIGKARAYLGRVSEEYVFEQVTWADLMKLIGCGPPTVEQETTFAQGPILTEWNGKVVSIDIAG